MAARNIPPDKAEAKRRYNQAYYARNKAALLERSKERRIENPDKARAQSAQNYERHKAAKKAAAARYKKANPDRVRQWQRDWENANRARKNELARESYARNREKENARVVEWTRRNRDKQTATRVRRRGLVLGASGKISAQDIISQKSKQGGVCYYCHGLPEQWEVDHFIPLRLGGTNGPENVVMACMPCNRSKAWKLPWEWKPDKFEPYCQP